jgi:hypothetical protein
VKGFIILALFAWAGILLCIVGLHRAELGIRSAKITLPDGSPLSGFRARIVSLFAFLVFAGIIYGFWCFFDLMPD